MTMKIASITLAEALGISLLGFSIVFFVLIVLMAVIKIMRQILETMEANKAVAVVATAPAASAAPSAPATNPNMVPAKGSLGEINLFDVDDKTAALIMAIVADEMKAPLNELRFKSIREKK